METNEAVERVQLFANEKSPLYWANLHANKSIVVNQGGTSSGKTEAIIRVLFTIAIIRKNYVITVISNTVTKLKEDALRIAKRVSAIPEVAQFITDYNITDRTYYFSNGSIIEFKSFEDEEQAKGGKRHILYINEATRISYSVFYQAYLRTKVRTFMDYNPTAEFWVHDRIIRCQANEHGEKEFNSVKVIRSWHIHNPYLTEEERRKIESIGDKDLYKVYALGLTGKLRGLIYPNWDEVEDFTWSDGVIWYVDWGYSEKQTADPVAVGRVVFEPPDSDLDYIADEVCYKQGVPASTVAQLIWAAGYKSGQMCYCDHSPDDIRELQLAGIAAYPAIKGPGSINSGVLFMRKKKIGYTRRSENIRNERRRYRFFEVDGIQTNTPVDEYNHHMDGIRYACRTHALRTGRV